MLDVDRLARIIDLHNQPVFVTADIENRACAVNVRMRINILNIVKVAPARFPACAIPTPQLFFGVGMPSPKFAQSLLTDYVHDSVFSFPKWEGNVKAPNPTASVLGKGDPKSGQIAGHLDRQPHLKSRHSRTYAPGCEWHATWLFNRDDHIESPQLVGGGNDRAACLAFPIFA
jgi:hypothetical protein